MLRSAGFLYGFVRTTCVFAGNVGYCSWPSLIFCRAITSTGISHQAANAMAVRACSINFWWSGTVPSVPYCQKAVLIMQHVRDPACMPAPAGLLDVSSPPQHLLFRAVNLNIMAIIALP